MMISNFRAMLLASAVAVAGSSAMAATNVVLDPSFETGLPWSLGGNGRSAPARSGSFALDGGCVGGGCVVIGLGGVGGTGVSTQTINLQPGIYQGSFFLQNLPGTPNQFAVSLGNNVVFNQPDLASGSYRQFSYISAVSGGSTTLAFGIRQDPGFSQIDDVSLVMVDDGAGNNISAAAQTVAVQASRDFLDHLQDRFNHAGSPIQMASVRQVPVASNDTSSYVNAGGKYRAFMSVIGSDGNWDDSSTSAQRRGLSAGIEVAADRGLDLGAAFAFTRTDFDTSSIFTRNSGEASEYLGAIYAHWTPSDKPFYINAMIGYGMSRNDFTRTSLVGLGSVVAQDVDATQWFGSVEAGYDWSMSEKFMLTPFARVDAAQVDQDGYAEQQTFASILVPAVVDGRNFDSARSVIGVRASLDLDVGRRGAKLGGKLGWAHEFDQDRFVTFSETTGPVTFTGAAGAARPAEDSVVAGANFEVPVSDDASLYLGYNGNFASKQDIHSGEIGLRVTW